MAEATGAGAGADGFAAISAREAAGAASLVAVMATLSGVFGVDVPVAAAGVVTGPAVATSVVATFVGSAEDRLISAVGCVGFMGCASVGLPMGSEAAADVEAVLNVGFDWTDLAFELNCARALGSRSVRGPQDAASETAADARDAARGEETKVCRLRAIVQLHSNVQVLGTSALHAGVRISVMRWLGPEKPPRLDLRHR